MKPNELRIGDWYESVKFGTPVRCELSDLYDLCAKSDGAYNEPPIEEMFKPIPLTEEWLLKFGAKLFPWGWVLNEFLIAWNRKGSFWIEVGNGKRIDFPYVHTLQNFFALTGEELTIKPPA